MKIQLLLEECVFYDSEFLVFLLLMWYTILMKYAGIVFILGILSALTVQ